jgi:phosphoenolpyruvate-protein phosphotransferase (PTS system enzyme I)
LKLAVKEEIYKGLPASKGISMGKPFVYVVEKPANIMSGNGGISSEKEIFEYKQAIAQSLKELDKIFNLAKEKLDEKNLQIFDAQLLFLKDEVLHQQVVKRIKQEKKSAYQSFGDIIKVYEDTMLASNDENLRERVADIEDIKNRVLRNLVKKKLVSKIDENSVVIARNLTPADTILFSRRKLLGFATDLGGTNSHVAIIARSLDVPAVVAMKDISIHIRPEDYVIVDGYKGFVIKNPSPRTIAKYLNQIKKYSTFEKTLIEFEKLPTRTKDGKDIRLVVNLEFNKELDYIISHIGGGVGLYRTEHLFLEMEEFPDEEAQYRQYKMLADRLYPQEVTIRTFDIGGDKLLPASQKESNPFLGWRGIRLCLDKEEVFMNQLRALLRASSRGNVKIMLPMIASIEEIRKTKKLIARARNDLKKRNIKYNNEVKVGIMVEVPSAVILADDFAKEVDFFSLGTNDLVQYLLAVDRESSMVSDLYQKFHPAVLKSIDYVVKSARKHNIEVSVCGEMAGDPIGCLILLGLGVDELSVETTSFLRIKKLIRMINFKDVISIAEKTLTLNNEKDIKEFLTKCYDKLVKQIQRDV